MGARGGANIKKVCIFEGIRGAGAEGGLVLERVHPGVLFYVVYAIDSILWPSRDRFAGIPGRRGVLGSKFRRFGDDFGTQKWT